MARLSIFMLGIFWLLIVVTGCDRPVCKNTNPVFDKISPDTKEYKDELVRELSKVDKSKLTYWMAAYWMKSHTNLKEAEYIRVHVQGEGLCAEMILAIKDSEKGIEEVLKNRMMGYKGAELVDLQFGIHRTSTSTEFVFQEVGGIGD